MIINTAKFLYITAFYFIAYYANVLMGPNEKKAMIQAIWLKKYFLKMGPLHIKMGQILATRSDLIPAAWVTTLSTLQDDVPGMSMKNTKESLSSNLSKPINELFTTFNFTPIASASIAQVHEAYLKTGERVAVKVLKKGVKEQMESNLKLIFMLINVLSFMSKSFRYLDVKERFEELSVLLLKQTDLNQERENQIAVKNNFEGHRYVVVPDVYESLSNESILVMEFMEGIPGKYAHKVKLNRKDLARRLQDTIYTMLYMHGLCHGDPHPGNLQFTEDGKLILLDFGITVALTEQEKWGLSSFYYACTRKEWHLAASRFTEHFVANTEQLHEAWDVYSREIEDVLKYHFDVSDCQWSTISYFKDVSAVLRKYNAKYTSNFTKVELVFLSCEGFATMIDPDINIWQNARIFTDRYSPYMSDEVKQRFDDFFQSYMPKSLALRDEAGDFLVAPTHIHRYFFPSAYPVFISEAEGGYFYDLDGNKFVDLSGGYGPHILGYKHKVIQDALSTGIESGLVNAIGNKPELELAKRLVDAFDPDGKAVLCNSGTEANLMAIRLARAYTKKNRIAKFEGHYHGWSDQGMVSSWFRFHGPTDAPEPISGSQGTDINTVKNTSVFQYGDVSGLNRLVQQADEIACVICEPMPSSIATCDVPFLSDLRRVCSENNIVLIFDEVVTGFRVAYGGAQTTAGIKPDLTTLGKIIGGGLPCGAVVGCSEMLDIAKSSEDPFFDYDNKAFVGGTMSGNSLTCEAGKVVLDYLKMNPDIYETLQFNSHFLANNFRKTAAEFGIDFLLEARNSIFSMTFGHRKSKLYRNKQAGSNFKANIALAYYMRKHGVYIPELHSFMISAAHTQDDIRFVGDAFKKSLNEMEQDGFFVH